CDSRPDIISRRKALVPSPAILQNQSPFREKVNGPINPSVGKDVLSLRFVRSHSCTEKSSSKISSLASPSRNAAGHTFAAETLSCCRSARLDKSHIAAVPLVDPTASSAAFREKTTPGLTSNAARLRTSREALNNDSPRRKSGPFHRSPSPAVSTVTSE